MNTIFRNAAPSNGSFLPADYITRKNEIRANILLLSLFALVMAGVVGAFMVTHRSWTTLGERETKVDELFSAEEKKIEQIKMLETQRAQIMEKAEITAALVEKIPRWALVGDVVLRMPKDMRLEQFVLKSKRIDPPAPPPPPPGSKPVPQVKTLTGSQAPGTSTEEKPKILPPQFEYTLLLAGAAELNNDVADFLQALRASPVLSNPELQFIKESKEKDKVFRKFEINATLVKNPDTEKIALALRELVEKHADAPKEKEDDKKGVIIKPRAKNAGVGNNKEGE